MLVIEQLKKILTAARGNALPIAELNVGFCALLNSFLLMLHPVQTASDRQSEFAVPLNLHYKLCGFFASIEPHIQQESDQKFLWFSE